MILYFVLFIILMIEQHNTNKQFNQITKILVDQDIRLKDLEAKIKKFE